MGMHTSSFIFKTPLQYVCACGKEKMVRYLLENGADATIKDKTGRDALAIAQYMQRDGVVKILQQKLKPPIEEQVKVLNEEYKEIIKDIQVRHVHERDLMEINRKMEMKNEELELPIRLLNEENFKNIATFLKSKRTSKKSLS
jgi:ankyrin repeat protein